DRRRVQDPDRLQLIGRAHVEHANRVRAAADDRVGDKAKQGLVTVRMGVEILSSFRIAVALAKVHEDPGDGHGRARYTKCSSRNPSTRVSCVCSTTEGFAVGVIVKITSHVPPLARSGIVKSRSWAGGSAYERARPVVRTGSVCVR